MMPSLAKSIALAAIFVSPTSLAFTTSPVPSARAAGSRTANSHSLLYNDAAGEDGARPPPRPTLASSQQEAPPHGHTVALPYTALPTHAPPRLAGTQNHDRAAPRSSEFHTLEPLAHTPARRARLDAEARADGRYVRAGSASYWDLRDEIVRLEEDLADALGAEASDAVLVEIRDSLRAARAKDPEHVYKVVGGAARSARLGSAARRAKYEEETRNAKRMLPQFNLEGMWVGKYGTHGFEMINVTYSGDQLIAYKVTGDLNIPRGEISFTADLSPPADNQPPGVPKLAPIVLSESSAEKWGTTRLPRFPGRGHAAEPGFVNHSFMEGQLVVIGEGDYFSFAWVPLEHQIFFGRPSPELTLRMLREGGGARLTAGAGLAAPGPDAGRQAHAEYVSRCFEVTSDAVFDELSEGKVDPFSCIWRGDDAEHCYFE